MQLRAKLLTGSTFLAILAVAAPVNAASVDVYQIVGSADSWWSPGPGAFYGGTPSPLEDSFGFPDTEFLTFTWTKNRTSSVTAPSGWVGTLGTAAASAYVSYTASISGTQMDFAAQTAASASLGNTPGVSLIKADGGASLFTYFLVPAGQPVALRSVGTIAIDQGGLGQAKYQLAQVFPPPPGGGPATSNVLFSVVAGNWDQTVMLQPGGTYRLDWYAQSYASSGAGNPAGQAATANMNVTTYVPEPAVAALLLAASGGTLLRPKRRRALRAVGGTHA